MEQTLIERYNMVIELSRGRKNARSMDNYRWHLRALVLYMNTHEGRDELAKLGQDESTEAFALALALYRKLENEK
jgi:hypothetical protein